MSEAKKFKIEAEFDTKNVEQNIDKLISKYESLEEELENFKNSNSNWQGTEEFKKLYSDMSQVANQINTLKSEVVSMTPEWMAQQEEVAKFEKELIALDNTTQNTTKTIQEEKEIIEDSLKTNNEKSQTISQETDFIKELEKGIANLMEREKEETEVAEKSNSVTEEQAEFIKKLDEARNTARENSEKIIAQIEEERTNQSKLSKSVDNVAHSYEELNAACKKMGFTLLPKEEIDKIKTLNTIRVNQNDGAVGLLKQIQVEGNAAAQSVDKVNKKFSKLFIGRWAAHQIKEVFSGIEKVNNAGKPEAEQTNIAGIFGNILAGAMVGGSVVGPAGAVIGAGVSAFTALQDASAKMLTASQNMMLASDQAMQANREILQNQDHQEQREENLTQFQKDVKALLDNKQYDEAEKLISGRLTEATETFQRYDKVIRQEAIQRDTITRMGVGGDNHRSFAQLNGYRNEAKADMKSYKGMLETVANERKKDAEKEAKQKEKENERLIKLEEARQKKLQSKILSNVQNESNKIDDKANNYRITDSLTRIGGGSGYASNVSFIQRKMNDIKSVLDDIYARIKESGPIAGDEWAQNAIF